MVRLKDIAARAGVSVMTVSKVLRDAPDISAGTKARIRALADEMGYVPDSLAQGLRTRSTKLLGLLVPNITSPLYSQIAMALEERTHLANFDLILAHSHNSVEREESCIRRLLSRRVDGLLVVPVYRMAPSAPIYEELARCSTPTVIIGHRTRFCQQFVNVETDDISGSFAATKHLIGLGHRRIAFFAGSAVSPSAQERLEGYRRALRESDIEVDDRLIFNAGNTIEDGQNAVRQMLEESTGATAIQSSNDQVAIGAASVLLDRGIQVPQQISVVGFGDIMAGEYFRVPLTTVNQPKSRIGIAAMESLAKLMRGESADSQTLSTELVIRASSGPAPKS